MPLPKLSVQFRRIAAVLLMLMAFSPLFAQNRIVLENQLPGTPQSAWEAGDGGTIEGFAEEFSVEPGQTVHFKIDIASGSPQPFTVKIYRIGWYQGNGARFIADLGNTLTGELQTTTTHDEATGRTDCSNWPRSAAWNVPADAVPGVYIARMDCPNVGGSAILLFVVTDPVASLNADLLFKTSDATWQAYNPYGENNFYIAAIPVPGYAHATKVSYQRPLHLRGDKSNFFNAEYPMIRWLERNGYDVSYTTDQAISRDNTPLTPSKCRVFLSVGHDEYWSAEARTRVETARNNGVHLAFFSGNEVYWKTRWEDNFQTLVCYKEGSMGELGCGTKCDPLPNVWTGLWRDGCQPDYAANDGCNPEGSLSGQMSWTQSIGSIKVPDVYKNLRFWKNTAVESLPPGGTLTLPYGTLGNEWDPEQFTENYPPHRTVLSNTLQTSHIHKMSLFRHANGALVFGAGTMQWAWGLDANHDLNTATPPVQPESRDMQQATLNLLFDMGVSPATKQADLILPSALNDVTPPTSVILSPFHGANVAGGSVTVSGNAVDNGGGALGGVEVSVDGGLTWNVADGLEDWSYTFSPSGYGTINIQVRAWDEFGNVETVGSLPSANSIAVSLTGPFNYSVFNQTYPQQAPLFVNDAIGVELGMKFRSSIPGYITGLKYYKGADVTGVHIGHLWDNNGNLLASETFVDETAFGWQTVPLSNPVLIQPNTTYVVSYFSPDGKYEKTVSFFNQSIQNGYLTGLASGTDGGNGVYVYNDSPAFPTETSVASNYWADVIMTPSDITSPNIVSTNPIDAATGVNLNAAVTINFDEEVDASTVNASTVFLTGPGNTVVPSSLNVSGSVITLTPNSALSIVTTYTVTIKGGITPPQIKDISGNALAADYIFSFTTGGLTAPEITGNPASTSTCANAPISFASSGTGIPTPTIQWQVSTNGGVDWSDISTANTATYTFTAQSTDNGKQYRAIYTNSEGADTTSAATLTVAATITASIQAVNANICPGDPLQVQLTAATGIAPFTLTINSQVYNNISVGEIIQPVLASENIFGPSDIPAEQIHSDNNAVELGVKFKSSVNGVIKGIRFHKGGIINGGVHIGNLWTTTGTLLATATFTNETNSGWQEVLFNNPVSVTANTVYVASCYMPQGNYSKSGGYFDGADHSNGQNLVAPQSTPTEPNGVYEYAGSSTYPSNDAFSTNYWVDVVFAPFVSASTTFNLTSINAANGCSLTGNPISSTSINVSPTVTAGVVAGLSPLCINATATYTKTGNSGGTWSSSNPAVASVNPTTGLVTALSAGSTDIIYTVNGCSGVATASQSLVVNPNANAGTINGSSSLCTGSSVTFTSNGNTGGTWSSSNTGVATVNSTTGEVTAIAPGNTDISYTLSVGCNSPVSSTLPVSVGGAGNAGTVSGTSPLCIGATATFTSNGDTGGTWSSSNPLVASVNATTGAVTALAVGTTDITYTVNGCVSTSSAFATLTVNNCASIVNLKMFLEGYYLGGGQMEPVLLNQGVGSDPANTDSITVELHASTAPYALIASATGILKTNGTASITFPSLNGSYFIAVRHRNTIQTWSANPVAVGESPADYDFTTAANKAYGDNMKQVSGVWVFFTGDINQDEFIDVNDFPEFDQDSYNGVNFEYKATDMNGDGFVDANDFPVFDLNSFNGVSSIHP